MFIFLIVTLVSAKYQLNCYIESLCPDTTRFIQASLKKASQTPEFLDVVEFHLVPYGKAKIKDGKVTCQHGELECYGNMMQACGISLLAEHQALEFVICIQADRKSSKDHFDAYVEKCAPEQMEAIQSCMKGTQGPELILKHGQETMELKPTLTHVPWVTVNGDYNKKWEDQILTDVVAWACRQEDVTIAACDQYKQ